MDFGRYSRSSQVIDPAVSLFNPSSTFARLQLFDIGASEVEASVMTDCLVDASPYRSATASCPAPADRQVLAEQHALRYPLLMEKTVIRHRPWRHCAWVPVCDDQTTSNHFFQHSSL